jgi:two-component system, LytTR family, response regulator
MSLLIPLNYEILFCEASGSYTMMHLETKKCFIKSKTLKTVEDEMPCDKFIRVHHKYLINRDYIRTISHDKSHIILINGLIIPISRRKQLIVKSFLLAESKSND